MQDKKLLFSLTKKDFRVDFYKGSGAGGQKRNKTENCCRITHIESGAVGKSEEGRSKEHNKQTAFQRMTETEEFQKWYKVEVARKLGKIADIENKVQKTMKPENIKIECKDEKGKWIEVSIDELEGEKFICSRCKQGFDISQLNEKIVDGTDDFYNLELCNKCNDIMSDYFSPEDIDKLIKE